MKKNQNKNIAIFAFSLVCLIGTYNAVMINSESSISSSAPLKNYEEMYEVKAGRKLAVSSNWAKVSKAEVAAAKAIVKTEAATPAVVEENPASIQNDLNMKLVEVINPTKWKKGVQASEFNGSIVTNNGIIENLTASLPEGLSVDISFSEMTGNTFEYDLNGEVFTGMMYQVDQASYMITMTNGPLEGTRLRFASESQNTEAQAEATKEYLAENHNVEVGSFGEEIQAQEADMQVEDAPAQTAEAASFNFNI